MKRSTDDKKKDRLTLRGRLTVERAAEIKAHLLSALEDSAHLRVRLEEVKEIDLSFLQLLIAARRACESLGGSLLLAGPLPPLYSREVERVGLQRHPDAEGTDLLPAVQPEV
jgi:anti-anti-sigma regulatory factor